MSGYLFDTCIVRNWYAKNAAVESRVWALPGASPLYISAITRGEIEFGHTNVASLPNEQAAFRKWIRETFEWPELPITGWTGDAYAKFRRRLFDRFDRKGKHTECREDKLGVKVSVDERDIARTCG